MSKINEAVDAVQDSTHNLLNHTKCKSHVVRAKNINMAESRHEERNKKFELLPRNIIFTQDDSSCRQMLQHASCAELSTKNIVSPSPAKQNNLTHVAAINTSISTNMSYPTKVIADGKMRIKFYENLSFAISMPSAHPNACKIKEIIHIFHEFRTARKVKCWKHLHISMINLEN